ncbi:MAG: efflux transporter outer membrane subunit [Acidobacteriota bacterium]|nr:efflux transporter outer membrane subunit [Acidobacteriota bacterium]
MKTNPFLLLTATAALSLSLGACTVGPKYHAPAPAAPPEYKGTQTAAPAAPPAAPSDPTRNALGAWNVADPKDGLLKGKWWEMYNEPELNSLEEQLVVNNQTIQASIESYAAARALIHESRAAYYPTASVGASGTRSRASSNTSSLGAQSTLLELPATVTWEPDLWGKVRNAVRQAQYNAQLSAADLENIRLTEQASLATYYFELRGQDAQTAILQQTLDADLKSLDYAKAQFETGVGTEMAMVQAQNTVDTVRSSLINLGLARAQYEHAIATLIGKPASEFSLPARALLLTPPAIPVGLPSSLLERRPDIAAAERQLASANAQIGIAKAAYYPSITLSATAGLESSTWKHLLEWPSRIWSIGPSASETVFDAGLRRATMQQYTAVYNGYLATYRQTVLTAFQQVEDDLAALRILSEQIQQQNQAVASAQRALDMELARYQTGVDPYVNVVTEQNTLLSAQQTLATLQMQRTVYSVALIEALGGGWERSQLPTPGQVSAKPAVPEAIQQ